VSETRDCPVLRGYAAAAEALYAVWEGLSSEAVLAPVLADLPAEPGRCLDLGAGSGRDAAWLSGRAHRVWAAVPGGGAAPACRRGDHLGR